ncbi:MAG: restriction endonuclease [Desulfurococcales archaeon]|nr:restriction endonuclease [Desulfurococcales archaeon]
MSRRRNRDRRSKKSSKGRRWREKGYLFEEVVAEYFSMIGYTVVRNVRLRGYSGALHEIDILLEKEGVKGVVEVKDYSSPVSKEWVAKIHSVAKDLGFQEVYLVASNGFTDGAEKVAKILGVKLLTLDDISRKIDILKGVESIPHFYAKPQLTREKARKEAEKKAEKILFISREEVTREEFIYYPFYAVKGVYSWEEEAGIPPFRKRILRSKEVALLLMDARTGSIPIIGKNRWELVSIGNLRDSEKRILALLVENDMTREEFLEKTQMRPQAMGRILSSLKRKGLIDVDEDGTYYTILPPMGDLEKAYSDLELMDRPERGYRLVEPSITSTVARLTASSLYGLSDPEPILVYLPIYRARLTRKDGSYRMVNIGVWSRKAVEIEIGGKTGL